MKPLVLTICVNYHTEPEVSDFARELLQQVTRFQQKLIIVDNNEYANDHDYRESPLDKLSREYEDVIYYRAGNNLGYYGAADWGLQQYLNIATLPDWIIVCNTDISFENNSFLATLVNLFDRSPPAVIAPSIISSNHGSDQNPFLISRPNKFRMHSYKFIFRYNLTLKTYIFAHSIKQKLTDVRRLVSISYPRLAESRYIYAPHGAFIIFNSKYFREGGTLKYGSFLFDEEIFVAETASKLGLRVLYEPQLKVIHKEHATTKTVESMRQYKYEAAKFCANTYFS